MRSLHRRAQQMEQSISGIFATSGFVEIYCGFRFMVTWMLVSTGGLIADQEFIVRRYRILI